MSNNSFISSLSLSALPSIHYKTSNTSTDVLAILEQAVWGSLQYFTQGQERKGKKKF